MAGWWEGEAPQENKKKVGLIAAGGAGTAAAIGAGAYLLSRGKAKPKGIKFAPVQPKVKTPKSPRPAPTPKAPSANVTRIILQPKKTPPVRQVKTPMEETNGITQAKQQARQQEQRGKQIASERKEANEVAPARWQDDPNLKGIPENATPEEVDRLLDATGPVPQKPPKNPAKARQARKNRGKGDVIKSMDQKILAQRVAMDMADEILKAATLTGEPGDKRNTKYALAGLAGYAVGVNTGSRLGARLEGTTWRKNRNKTIRLMENYATKQKAKISAKNAANPRKSFQRKKPMQNPDTWQPSLKEVNRINMKVKGSKGIVAGSITGAVAGTATGAGLYAAHRAKKRRQVQM